MNSKEFLDFEISQKVAIIKISADEKIPEIENNDILVYFDTKECKTQNECTVPLHIKIKNNELLKMKAHIEVEPTQIKLTNIKVK